MRFFIAAVLAMALSGCSDIICGHEYSVAALRHLPHQDGYGDCDSFICKDEGYQTVIEWAKKIRSFAKSQNEYCVRQAYEGWADYYETRANESRSAWQKELKSREIELRLAPHS